jgi:hypothetical protein
MLPPFATVAEYKDLDQQVDERPFSRFPVCRQLISATSCISIFGIVIISGKRYFSHPSHDIKSLMTEIRR